MRFAPLGLLLTVALGCGSTPATSQVATTSDTAQPTAAAVASVEAAPCPEAPASGPQSDQTDPDILALAAATKKCEFSSGSFNWECPAYKEWRGENEDLFEGVNGNSTLLSMLEDSDVRMRALVVERGFFAGRSFFADKKRVTRLLAVVDKEREPRLLRAYGKFVAHIDGEKAFGKELEAYVKHPTMEFRDAYAEHVLPQHPSEFSLKLTKAFLDDPDWSVRRSAIRSLSAGGRTRPTDKICELLRAQLVRDDKLADDALDAGSTSKCKGMAPLVVAEIEKRAKEPAKLNAKDAPSLTSPLSQLCWRSGTPEELKKRAFDVALKVAPKIEDSWRKRRWIDLFHNCDVNRAKAALTPYLKDKDKDTAESAKNEIQRVEEELARK